MPPRTVTISRAFLFEWWIHPLRRSGGSHLRLVRDSLFLLELPAARHADIFLDDQTTFSVTLFIPLLDQPLPPSAHSTTAPTTNGCATKQHDGDIPRYCADTRRRNKTVRGLQIGSAAACAAQVIRKGTPVHPDWLRVRVGRERSRHAEVDRRKIVERQQSIGKLPDVPGDGGQAWWWLRHVIKEERRQDTRFRSRQ